MFRFLQRSSERTSHLHPAQFKGLGERRALRRLKKFRLILVLRVVLEVGNGVSWSPRQIYVEPTLKSRYR